MGTTMIDSKAEAWEKKVIMIVGMGYNIIIEYASTAIVATIVRIMAKLSIEAVTIQEAAIIILSKEMGTMEGVGYHKWSITGTISQDI